MNKTMYICYINLKQLAKMKTKQTKGEWKVNYGNINSNRFTENFASQNYVHAVHLDLHNNEQKVAFAVGKTLEEATANARLIAVAPELLKMLIEIKETLLLPEKERPEFWVTHLLRSDKSIGALIKKATE